MVTDAQVRNLMREMGRTGQIGVSSARAGMSENTARKYLRSGQWPSEVKKPRTYRTRQSPFEEDWPWVREQLAYLEGVEAKLLFEGLCRRRPNRYQEGQLRTFQRHVKNWRASHGPEKEVFFEQRHRPGEALQTDFTVCDGLMVTVMGEPFPHKLCHTVLPYSNWASAVVCRSEAWLPMKRGLQRALLKLGGVPEWHQTDHSTAACHFNKKTGKFELNDNYKAMMAHFGVRPRLTGVGKKEQNGDVESAHNGLKRRLKQYLLFRGNRDFESVEAYQQFVDRAVSDANRGRSERLAEEVKTLKPLRAARLPDYDTLKLKVGRSSTVRVKVNTYSVPSRLIGETVTVRLSEAQLEVWHGGMLQMSCERLLGQNQAHINYRHVIWSLVNKPGAFERYRYREELFPTLTFRRAWDTLTSGGAGRRSALIYLRVLHLAASTLEAEVEAALELLLESGEPITFDSMKALVAVPSPGGPTLEAHIVDLGLYDTLVPTMSREVLP